MKLKLASSLLSILMLSSLSSLGQETNTGNFENRKHSLGVGLGLSTGNGLSYQFQPGRFGLQLNYGVQFSPRYASSSGITFLYNIVDREKWDLFLYQGNHVIYWGEGDDSDTQGGRYWIINGLGLGYSKVFWNRLKLSGMLGAALLGDSYYSGGSQVPISPSAEIGIHFLL